MNIVLLQVQLSLQEVELLLKEFPQYLFLTLTETSYKNLSQEHWGRVEILFGSRLTCEELALARQLRWIHSPAPFLKRLCMAEIEKQGNILVTTNTEENVPQRGEYVLGSVLGLAKNLMKWKELNANPPAVWNSKLRESMWSMQNRIHLQIGMGAVGTEIARRMNMLDMKVWGVRKNKSFHPSCHKVFSTKELHSLLPAADVVCVSLPRGGSAEVKFRAEELGLMKEDAILVILGTLGTVSQDALVEVACSGKLRGIVLDLLYDLPIPPNSPLWKAPGVLITPEVASRPKTGASLVFRTFLFNFRQYLHGNFWDMRNIVGHVDRTIG